MIIVIIAGGSGTRLWPLSTPEFPKHLLNLSDSDKSLLQLTYQRANKITDNIYIVSESGHINHVREQLTDLDDDSFIVEPARRGTANCIITALIRVSKNHDKNEPIVFLSADHYIRDTNGFRQSFMLASKISQKEKKIVLVGVEPDYPAIGFGYIQKDGAVEGNSFVYKVHSFKEKPDIDLAKRYLRSGGYLWNCGYFVGSLNTFVDSMKLHSPELYENYLKLKNSSSDDYEKNYLDFSNMTIDYELIEKVNDLIVVQALFDWLDLGSFSDLYKAVEKDNKGNHLKGGNIETEEVENSFIQNHEDKPLAVIGLDNIVVINSPNGILVTRKDMSQKIGEVSKRINSK